MNTWGNGLRLSIFGESHGPAVGMVVDGLPPGERIDLQEIQREMERRAPGRSPLSTTRSEADRVELLSGLYEGKTTGAPVTGVIRNGDARPSDYGTALRPGHADWTALLKYGGHADPRGGGHLSGRLTAPLVFAGALAKQVLARRGVQIYGRAMEIGGVTDGEITCDPEAWREVAGGDLPVYSAEAGERMRRSILAAKEAGDSVGGVVETAAFGLPGGLGEPFFGSVESAIASLLFSIPAVKGVEFGAGFHLARMRGSEANDELYLEDGIIRSRTNHNGGVLGGIANGMPLTVRAAVKPTPSIAREQRMLDAITMESTLLRMQGRHDPCIVPRAVVVVEAAVAVALLDLLLRKGDAEP